MGHVPAKSGRFCCQFWGRPGNLAAFAANFGADLVAWSMRRCRRCVDQASSCFLSFGKNMKAEYCTKRDPFTYLLFYRTHSFRDISL